MNLEYFIARKVAASGQRSFSRLIIRIAIVGIALSMTVMIVATSLIRGFKSEISSKIFGFWGHIHITDANINRSFEAIPVDVNQDFYPFIDTVKSVSYVAEASYPRLTKDDIPVVSQSKGGVDHIQVFALTKGIIETKETIEGIVLKGIWKDFKWDFFNNYLVEGRGIEFPDSTASNDILISQQTSRRLKLGVDDKFVIHFIKNKDQVRRRFTVCGIYKTGLEEYDKRFALVDLRKVQQLHDWEDTQISGYEVFIEYIDDLELMNSYIHEEKLPMNLYAESIRDKFPSIFEWLELQNINEIVIIFLMIIVSIINMITALMILILERTNMIGTLKSLGQSNWSIRKIFLYYAAYIISIGIVCGNILGITICMLQDKFEIIKLSEEDYYLSVAPIELNVWSIVLINIGTLLITLLFLILPSYLVTNISPVKAMRFK